MCEVRQNEEVLSRSTSAKQPPPAAPEDDASSGIRATAHAPGHEPTDAELVARARADDREARGTIVRRHGPKLRGLARRLLRSREAGDDIVQDTFVHAFEKLHTIRQPESLGAWLSQVVAWKSISFLRREKLRRRLGLGSVISEEEYLPPQPVSLPDPLARQDAAKLLASLPVQTRVMWCLQRVEGYTVKEVAEITGSTVDKVKKRLVAAEQVMAGYRKDGAL